MSAPILSRLMAALPLGAIALAGCAMSPERAPQPVATRDLTVKARDSGWQTPRAPDDLRLVEGGRQIAKWGCASCHAIDRTSLSPRSDAPPLRLLLQEHDAETLARRFIEGGGVGHADMPVFDFNGLAADALIAYLKSLGADPPIPNQN